LRSVLAFVPLSTSCWEERRERLMRAVIT